MTWVKWLEKMLSIAGPPLSSAQNPPLGAGYEPLMPILSRLNGFFAFESALHVFPGGPVPDGITNLESWNGPDCWRYAYRELADGLVFFAEDIFGGQFAFHDGAIAAFEPETGAVEKLADDLEGWAEQVLTRYAVLTGYPIAHRWQAEHGPIPAGQRLLPKRPFVLGGKYELENLYALDAGKGMCLRGELAVQIKDLPDGARIEFKIIE
jgi:hypothetical protein